MAFDAKANDVDGHVTPKMLEPAWLVANAIVRIEYLSYGPDGTLSDHYTYVVDRKGNKQRVWDD